MMNHSSKGLGFAAVLALGVASAASANAGTFNITGAGIYPTDIINFQGSVANAGAGPYNGIYSGPVLLTLSTSATVWAFQVDFNHGFGLGLDYQAPVNLNYQNGFLTNDSTGTLSGTGNSLSQATSGAIGELIHLGVAAAADYTNNPSSTVTDEQLASYQAAIFDLEYGLHQNTGDATPTEISTIGSLITYAEANPISGYALTINDPNGVNAVLGVDAAIPVTSVPEPSAWALMLVGFGGLGGAMRARRKAVAA